MAAESSDRSGGLGLNVGDRPSREEVQRRINSLYDAAETATGNYNATRAMAAGTRPRPRSGTPTARPSDPALDAVTRQWFDAARSQLGPTVPAMLPAGRTPARSAAAGPGIPSPRRGDDGADRDRTAGSRAVAELTAGPSAAAAGGPVLELAAGPAIAALPPAPQTPQAVQETAVMALSAPAVEPQAPAPVAVPEQTWTEFTPDPEPLAQYVAQPWSPTVTVEPLPAENTWRTASELDWQPTPDLGIQATPDFGTQPSPDFGTQPDWRTASELDWQPTPDLGIQATPDFGTQLTPGFGTQPIPDFSTPLMPDFGAQVLPDPGWQPAQELDWQPAPQEPQQQQLVAPVPELTFTAAPSVDIAPAAGTAGKTATALDFARAQIGKPCLWGATGPDVYDSSSLVQAAWRAAGVLLPRTVQQQASTGTPVPLADLRPGDIIFFHGGGGEAGHVGLYTGNSQMIHAPGPGTLIREESIFYAGPSVIHGAARPA
jgi:cell wall-associated NlpC family hydrolase